MEKPQGKKRRGAGTKPPGTLIFNDWVRQDGSAKEIEKEWLED